MSSAVPLNLGRSQNGVLGNRLNEEEVPGKKQKAVSEYRKKKLTENYLDLHVFEIGKFIQFSGEKNLDNLTR